MLLGNSRPLDHILVGGTAEIHTNLINHSSQGSMELSCQERYLLDLQMFYKIATAKDPLPPTQK